MSVYSVSLNGVLRGTPHECWGALWDEVTGRTSWWFPYLQMHHAPDTPVEAVSCVVHAVANASGAPDKPWGSIRWSSRLVSMTPHRQATWSVFAGAFRGVHVWTLAAKDADHTAVLMEWRVDPAGWNRVWATFLDEASAQHRVFRQGLIGLQRHLRAAHRGQEAA